MKFSHSLISLSALCLIGCSDNATVPMADSEWDGVRLHEGGAETYRDLTVEYNGQLMLETSDRGGVSPARGLLAGERLETLTRVIGDLPLDSSVPSDCPDSDYFISLIRDGEVQTYRGHQCGTPSAVETLRDLMADVATEVQRQRSEDRGAVRVLASGHLSDIRQSQRIIAESRDELIRLLQRHDPRGLTALPPVDFDTEVVIGFFAGMRNMGGYDLGLGLVNAGDGWIRIETIETGPGPNCMATLATTQPFLFVAAKRASEGFLFDSKTVTRHCE